MSSAGRARSAPRARRRRSSWLLPRPRLRDGFDGVDDRVIAGAATVVAGQMLADLLAARHAAGGEQGRYGQQHAGRTEAALQRVAGLERLLQIRDGPGV